MGRPTQRPADGGQRFARAQRPGGAFGYMGSGRQAGQFAQRGAQSGSFAQQSKSSESFQRMFLTSLVIGTLESGARMITKSGRHAPGLLGVFWQLYGLWLSRPVRRTAPRSFRWEPFKLVSRIRDSFKKSRHVWPEYLSNIARSSGGWHRLSWSR